MSKEDMDTVLMRKFLIEELTKRITEAITPVINEEVSRFLDQVAEEIKDAPEEDPVCVPEGCEDCPHYPCDEDEDNIDEDAKTVNINISDEQAERLLRAIFGDTGFFGDRKKKRTKAEE